MPTSATGIWTDSAHRAAASAARRARAAGFTLLELLVVVAIIGLLAGVAVLSVGIVGDDRDVEREALRLRTLLELVREEALMQSRDFGVLFSEDGYRFYIYDHAVGRWLEPMDDRLLAPREVAAPLRMELSVEDRDLVLDAAETADEEDEDVPEPQVMVLSSGEMTPFRLLLSRPPEGGRRALIGELDGTLEITEPENASAGF